MDLDGQVLEDLLLAALVRSAEIGVFQRKTGSVFIGI